MKAMEGQLKWSMKRDEEKLSIQEAKEDVREVMNWRQGQKTEISQCASVREQQKKVENLDENRTFQEFKRDAKVVDVKVNSQRINEEYLEKKEHSEWAMDLKRTLPLEEQKIIVDAHLEGYTHISMYNIEEAQREKFEQKISRDDDEELNLSYQMLEARRERDSALQSLEYYRAQQRLDMPGQNDIPTRPFSPLTKPL